MAVVAIGATALATGATAAVALGGITPSTGDYWGCAGVRQIDVGICLENPLPERLLFF